MKRPTPTVPVSWGELIDKITILEIKAERFASDPRRLNVENELSHIRALADDALAADTWLCERKAALRTVNEALWNIEDQIRDKESASAFDSTFIELARSVYKKNDERARIKKEINVHMASEIVEEKSYKDY